MQMHSVGGGLVGGLSMAGGAPRPRPRKRLQPAPGFTLEAGCTREAFEENEVKYTQRVRNV